MKSIQSLDDVRSRRLGESVVRRMEWIENRLYWTGKLRRRDVCARFAISPQQASLDIAAYLTLRPDNLVYDSETKSYLKSEQFNPIFGKNAGFFLESETERFPPIGFERVASPWRPGEDAALTALIAASESKTPVEVLYLSLRRKAPIRRTICPHNIVDADGRLHVRAFDYKRRLFADFIVARIADAAPDQRVPWVDQAADVEWHEYIEISVVPDPELSKEQRQAAMKDLGLPPKGGGLRTRRALAFYLARTLRLGNVKIPDPGKRYLCANPGELDLWIRGEDRRGDVEA